MTGDGLIELDEECWTVLAKYNLLLATVFGSLLLLVRALSLGEALLIQNGILTIVFGGVQTYCWISR